MVFDSTSSSLTADLVHRDVVPQLKTLVDLVSKASSSLEYRSDAILDSFVAEFLPTPASAWSPELVPSDWVNNDDQCHICGLVAPQIMLSTMEKVPGLVELRA